LIFTRSAEGGLACWLKRAPGAVDAGTVIAVPVRTARARPARPVASLGVVAVVSLVALGVVGVDVVRTASPRADAVHADTFATGTVSLGDDDAGGAMFSVGALVPGATGSRCVTVTYTGDVPVSVKLYATPGSAAGTLGTYLDLTVEQGTGGSFAGGCGAFVPSATLYSGTLAGFVAGVTGFASGVGTFTPATGGTTCTYRWTYVLQQNDTAQGRTASVGFTWESRST
jgi:hypothetical protein